MKRIFAIFFLILPVNAFATAEYCGTADSVQGEAGLAAMDTVRAIAIYAVGSGYLTERVPLWHRRIFEIDTSFSIPKYFKDHSNSQHILLVDVYGRRGLNDTLFFISSRPQESTGCFNNGQNYEYINEIFEMADPAINYGLYDRDTNGYVDKVFFVTMSDGDGGWALGSSESYYESPSDTNARGEHVRVSLSGGVCIAPDGGDPPTPGDTMRRTVRLACHEYGHLLGLGHAFGLESGPCFAQGIYNMMGYPPGSPYWPPVMGVNERLWLQWITPTTVTQTQLDVPVRNYLTDNELYRIRAIPGTEEYFYVSHYFGKNYINAKYWERVFDGDGILIWHFDYSTGMGQCNTETTHKAVDLELAHGLYDYSGYSPPVENDSAGKDSLEIQTPYGGGFTSPSMYWTNATKIYFDKLSNPSSYGYDARNTYIQRRPTHVGISNIRGDGVAPETVDFIINNRVGRINANDTNTTWEAGTYTINGDLTIDSNVTLIIKPGAIVKFAHFRDRMSAGVDTKKPEIIVKGTLKAEGKSDSLIKFISFRSTPSDTDWYGIRVLPGGSAKLKYAQIKHAYIGATFEDTGSDTVANCLFDSNYVYGIKAWNNNLVVRNSTIKNMPAGYGIYAKDYTPKIENNYFDSLKYGVSAGRATITGNRVKGRSGISERAISCDNGNPSTATVTSDTVVGTFSDTYFESYKSVANISDCVLGDTTSASAPVGIRATIDGTAYVRNTNIYGYTSKGVYGKGETVDLGDETEMSDPGNNNIRTTASGTKAVWNSGSATLMAESNWWGQAPPPSSLFQGLVDYTPYLSSPGGPAKLLPTGIPIADNTPKSFAVSQNYPNPFNPTTVIEYSIPVSSRVSIRIYNILGQVVKTLADENKLAGTYSVTWDGTNISGKQVTSGVYFYLVKTDDFKETKKMTLIR